MATAQAFPATGKDNNNEFDAIRFAKAVSMVTSRSSLTREAQNNIAMYPSVMSGDIPVDDAVTLAKGLELHYASLLVSVISSNSTFDASRYSGPTQYIRAKFHNNNNIPALLRAGIESQLPDDFAPTGISAAFTSADAGKLAGPDFVLECWIGSDSYFNLNVLNHEYHPASATQQVMESIAAELRKLDTPALEAGGSDYLERIGRAPSRNGEFGVGKQVGKDVSKKFIQAKDENGNDLGRREIRRRYDDTGTLKEETVTAAPVTREVENITRSYRETAVQKGIVNSKLSGMEPTMIQLTLTGTTENVTTTHNIVMGVKVMVQQVQTDVMVSNLVQGVSGSRAMFSFIKWTQGQLSFIKDFIFGVANAKEAAVSNNDMKRWIGALKRKKQSNFLSRVATGDGIPPTTTIVLTAHEAARVLSMTGVDLNEPLHAVKLLNAYYILGIVIVDTANGQVKTLFDGDTKYTVSSLNAIKGKSSKDTDLSTFISIVRAAGGLK